MVVLFMALIAAGGLALVFTVKQAHREPPVDAKAATASPAVSTPAPGAQDQSPAGLAAVEAETKALGATLSGSPPTPESGDGVPAFDITRIEPTGDAVIAGRAAPGATVELLRNGELHVSATADQSGRFVMVPPRLPPGTYDLTLRSRQPDGTVATSKQSVAVALQPTPTDRPMVARMTPDKPSVVASQPAAPTPMTGMVAVEAIEAEPDGKFHVTGRAGAGATVRLYLNDSFVASAVAGADERFVVTINKGVSPGNYRVRLDEVEPNSNAVRARAEVSFNVPDKVVTASMPAQATSSKGPDTAASQQPAAAVSTALQEGGSPSAVVVPKITTTTVSRGDSLWHISRLTYGAGTRYPTIYRANRGKIRNPDLIYPGQIFVLPTR
jgi:nucleoid-associated protein YgaU